MAYNFEGYALLYILEDWRRPFQHFARGLRGEGSRGIPIPRENKARLLRFMGKPGQQNGGAEMQ